MSEKIQTRVIIIVVAILLCIVGIVGLPKNVQQLRANVQDRIHLGLDLKGGTHLVLRVHVDDAVKVTTDEDLERLKDELKAKNIPYADVLKTDDTHIVLKGIPQNKAQDVQALVSEGLSKWDLARGPVDSSTGTLSFNLGFKTSEWITLRTQTLEQARETITNRIDQFGVTEPVVADYGTAEDHELVVELPSVDDPTRVKDLIQATALLELKIVQDGPYPTKEAALASHGGVLPPDSELVQAQHGAEGGEPPWYVLNRVAAITGRDLTGAQQSTDSNGRPDVLFTLNRDGATRFARITGQNIGKYLAIVLDNRVVDAPVIHGQISDRGEIEGNFTVQSAADLALVLRTGALPASVTYEQEETIGPSLGADSIRHGVIASIVGFVAIMTFMLVYYRGAGVNADVALILNLLILIAALAYFGATLTLPGIAGVILTVGMGVDSNVLIFERIREEIRAGKAVGAAVAGGFSHAFVTIIDTHVTTVVSAAILFWFGTGPIKGFAVTLTIGLIANLFTSVFVSRVIFDYGLSRRERGAELSI
jgi:preprotein translocase subunit SecD